MPAFDRVLVMEEKAFTMTYGKRPKLPRGLRWRPKSSQICFSWRDAHASQHQQSTHTTDPAEAMGIQAQLDIIASIFLHLTCRRRHL